MQAIREAVQQNRSICRVDLGPSSATYLLDDWVMCNVHLQLDGSVVYYSPWSPMTHETSLDNVMDVIHRMNRLRYSDVIACASNAMRSFGKN